MSNLYIRVLTGFYTHKKTIRLKIKLGADAFWIPPRIWAYAAENQPDGDLSAYSSEELAELIGFSSNARCNAQAMLQALKDSGFIEENGTIHDWHEHNGYHKSFSERAKKAAIARWSKEKPPAPPKEETGKRKEDSGDKHCISNAPSINGKPKAAKAAQLSDSEFIESLKKDPTYSGINIEVEHGKMVTWCAANNRQPNRRRFVNWINRCDRPMITGNQPATQQNGKFLSRWTRDGTGPQREQFGAEDQSSFEAHRKAWLEWCAKGTK